MDQLLLESPHEVARGVAPRPTKELIARGDLENGAHVAARTNRYCELADRAVEDRVKRVLDAQTVILRRVVPFDEADDDVDALAIAHARDAEQRLDVQYAEAAGLDVMPKQVGCRSEDDAGWTPVATNDVVSNKSMTSEHELEGALALPNSALSEQ